jgi:hypothetical protein
MGFFTKAHPTEISASQTREPPEKDARDSESVDVTGNRLNNGKVQSGVARIEATTAIWSRHHLIAAYAM